MGHSQIPSFYNPSIAASAPVSLPNHSYQMTVDPVIDPFNNASYAMSDYQRYQQLVANEAVPSSSSQSLSTSPPNTASFQRSAFYSSDDQRFGANEHGQTYLSSEQNAFYHDPFEHDFDYKVEDIDIESVQNDKNENKENEKQEQVVKNENVCNVKIEIVDNESSEDEKEEIVTVRRKRGRRGCHRRSKTLKTTKCTNTNHKSMRIKAKPKRKK